MTSRAMTIWKRLSLRVDAISDETDRAYGDLCSIGSLWPYTTFPEERAAAVAAKLETIAAGIRDSLARAEAARAGKEAA